MERAKIALFEDDNDVKLLARLAISCSSHELVVEASSQREALEIVEQVSAGELDIDVYMIDGRLSTLSGAGEDALIIHDYISALELGGTILGFSAEMMDSDHCDVSVPNKDIFKAIDIIDALPTPS